MIYVTHDQVEAMTLADQIVVINAGRIEQVGSPMELYSSPRTEFVAAFIGSPKMNLIKGEAAKVHGAATLGIRPEHIQTHPSKGEWPGTLRVVEHLGNETIAYVESSVGQIIIRLSGHHELKAGETVKMTPDNQLLHRFDDKGKRIRARK